MLILQALLNRTAHVIICAAREKRINLGSFKRDGEKIVGGNFHRHCEAWGGREPSSRDRGARTRGMASLRCSAAMTQPELIRRLTRAR